MPKVSAGKKRWSQSSSHNDQISAHAKPCTAPVWAYPRPTNPCASKRLWEKMGSRFSKTSVDLDGNFDCSCFVPGQSLRKIKKSLDSKSNWLRQGSFLRTQTWPFSQLRKNIRDGVHDSANQRSSFQVLVQRQFSASSWVSKPQRSGLACQPGMTSTSCGGENPGCCTERPRQPGSRLSPLPLFISTLGSIAQASWTVHNGETQPSLPPAGR